MSRGKSKSTLAMEAAINQIVDERSPITVRGVCYALFIKGLIDSMGTTETNRVSRIMTAMREDDQLDWRLIVDGSRAVNRINTWSDPSQIISAAVREYRRDYWQDQPLYVEVWSEKSTVQGVLAPILDEFGVTFRVMKGFGSFTAVKQAATDSLELLEEHDQAITLYLGDWDPSGLYMSEVDLPSRLERYGGKWDFTRIALTQDDLPRLPHFDARTKSADRRYQWFTKNYGARAWELDALDPNVLRKRVREQIEARLNLHAWDHAKRIEAAEVESMRAFHRHWHDCQKGLDGG